MPLFTKQKSTLHLLLTNSNQATAHGGQVLVDALCRRFGLWKRIHQTPSLDPRKRTGAGFSPVANAAQLLFTLTSGGASLADAERLGQDRVLMHLLGLVKGADQTTLGEWLRAQTKESVMDLHRINAEFVDWASQQAKPGRWLHAGEAEVFFQEVDGCLASQGSEPLTQPGRRSLRVILRSASIAGLCAFASFTEPFRWSSTFSPPPCRQPLQALDGCRSEEHTSE